MVHFSMNLVGRKGRIGLAAIAALSIATAGATIVSPSPARANCYELIGCTNKDYFTAAAQLKQLSCQILWEVRNTIYKENGYCFHSKKAIKAFPGNAGCQIDDMGKVPLNAAESHNVIAIKKAEAKKGC